MALMLTISKLPEGAALADQDKTFGEKGGKIGRAPGNDWILPDEHRYLSSFHAAVAFEAGQYFLVDTSTNGVFINSSDKPLGKGNKHPLKDGDTVALGDYLLVASVTSFTPHKPKVDSEEQTQVGAGADAMPDFDAWLSPDVKPAAPVDDFASDPFFNPLTDEKNWSGSSDPTPSMLDPLKALDKTDDILGDGPESEVLLKRGSMGEKMTPDQLAFVPPRVSSANAENPNSFARPASQNEGFADKMAALDAFLDDPIDQQMPAPTSHAAAVNQSIENKSAASALDAFLDDGPLTIPPSPSITPVAEVLVETPSEPLVEDRALSHLDSLSDDSLFGDVKLDDSFNDVDHVLPSAPVPTPAKIERSISGAIIPGQLSPEQVKTFGSQLGIDLSRLSDEEINALPAQVGDILKEAIQGLMKVLSARTSLKNEFRINMTTIQPQENNPLKFSASYEDALEKMFVTRSGAYLNAKESIGDAFQDVGFHQMAMLAGMREAYNAMMNRFSPDILQQRFDEFGKKGSLIGGKKAAYWDMYRAEFEKLKGDKEHTFKQYFGNDFAEAYEHFLTQLKNR